MSTNRTLCGVLLLCSLALFGCNSLSDIESNVCGNGAVEKEVNEDCDLFADTETHPGTVCGQPDAPPEQRCRYICTNEDDAMCPAGWACDRSGVCQFGSGSFRQSGGPVALSAENLALGDVDGDGVSDLIGFSESSVQVRLGTGTGQFGDETTFTTPTHASLAQFRSLDGDPSTDGVLPLELGLVILRGQATGELLPVPAIGDVSDDPQFPDQARAQLLQHTSIPRQPLSRALTFIGDRRGAPPEIEIFSRELDGADASLPIGAVPGLRVIDNLTRVPTADLDLDPALDGGDMALAFTGDDRVFIVGLEAIAGPMPRPENNDIVLRSVVPLPAGFSVGSGVMFADEDGDDRLDLLISAADGAGDERVLVASGAGDGSFTPPGLPDSRFDLLFDECVLDAMRGFGTEDACARLPIAAGDVDGDGRADYISANAIYLTVPGNPLRRVTDRLSPSAWTEALMADFNGDGAVDIAAVSNDDTGLDFLIGDSSGFFTSVRLVTRGEPYSLRVGDFDGNFVSDLAFAEELGAEDDSGPGSAFENRNAISVVFGEPGDHPVAAVTMGRFASLEYCEVGRVAGVADLNDDLYVDSSDENRVAISQFFGTAQRRLVSPLFFGQGGGPERLDMAIAGTFVNGMAPAEFTDVAAITGVTRPPFEPQLWVLDGAIRGDSPRLDDQVGGLEDLTPGDFDLRCALFTSGDIDGDQFDEIIGVDGTDDCYDSDDGTAMPPRLLIIDVQDDPIWKVSNLPGDKRVPRELAVADLDLDEKRDIVITYAGLIDENECTTSGNSGVVVYWGDGAGGSDGTAVIPGASNAEIPSVAVFNADDDLAPELAIWTSRQVSIADSNDEAGDPRALETTPDRRGYSNRLRRHDPGRRSRSRWPGRLDHRRRRIRRGILDHSAHRAELGRGRHILRVTRSRHAHTRAPNSHLDWTTGPGRLVPGRPGNGPGAAKETRRRHDRAGQRLLRGRAASLYLGTVQIGHHRVRRGLPPGAATGDRVLVGAGLPQAVLRRRQPAQRPGGAEAL